MGGTRLWTETGCSDLTPRTLRPRPPNPVPTVEKEKATKGSVRQKDKGGPDPGPDPNTFPVYLPWRH